MNDELARKLPFSLIAEQSLLGSILVDPEALNDVTEIISPQAERITSALSNSPYPTP